MSELLLYGFIGGVIFYFVKLIAFMILTMPKWMRWLRRLAHNSPLGLFLLDVVAGIIISSTIHSVGAEGLTVLFFFTGFSLTSILYILLHMGLSWTRRVSCSIIHGPLW